MPPKKLIFLLVIAIQIVMIQGSCNYCMPQKCFLAFCTECRPGAYDIFFSCHACAEGCATCWRNATFCQSCVNGWFLFGFTCVQTCPAGYFGNTANNHCEPCDYSTCKTCSQSATSCTSCTNPEYYLDVDTCKATCPAGKWMDNSQLQKTCQPCESPCATCLNSAKFCTGCDSTAPLLVISNHTCSSPCPDGTWYDSSSSPQIICQPCDYTTCATCSKSATNCTSCSSTELYLDVNGTYDNQYTLLFTLGSCVALCPNGKWQRQSQPQKTCEPCISPCATCNSSSDNCTTCDSTAPLLVPANHTCVFGHCPFGTWLESSQGPQSICLPCNSPCTSCEMDPNTCLTCNTTLPYLLNSSCRESCPDGYWYNNSQEQSVCQACNDLCLTCHWDTDNCLSCKDGLLLDENSCVEDCVINHFIEGKYCVQACSEQNPFIYNGAYCRPSCPKDQPYSSDYYCMPYCPQENPYANGYTCLALCPILLEGTDCVSKCSSLNPYINSGECLQNCPSPLVSSGYFCLDACPEGEFQYGTTCLNVCPTNSPYNLDGVCVSTCPSTDVIAGNQCVGSCPTSLSFLYNGTCFNSCPTTTTLVAGAYCCDPPNTVIFQNECYASCPIGSFLGENRICDTTCPIELPYILEGKCVSTCNAGQFAIQDMFCCNTSTAIISSSGSCIETTITSTGPTSSTGIGSTTTPIITGCLATEYLQGALCVKQCKLPFFISGTNCVSACPSTTPFITNGNTCTALCNANQVIDPANNCLDSCQAPYLYLNSTFCLIECPIGLFSYDFICQKTCPAIIYFDECVNACPDGTVLVGTTCQTSLYLSAKLVGCVQTQLTEEQCVAGEALLQQVRFFTSGNAQDDGSYIIQVGLSGPSLCDACLSFTLTSGASVFALNETVGGAISGNWTQYQFNSILLPTDLTSLNCSVSGIYKSCVFAVTIISPGTNLTYSYPFSFVTSQIKTAKNQTISVAFATTGTNAMNTTQAISSSSSSTSTTTSTSTSTTDQSTSCLGSTSGCAPPPTSLCVTSDATCGTTNAAAPVSTTAASFSLTVAMNDLVGDVTPVILSIFAVNGDNITDVTSLMSVTQGYHQAIVTLPTAPFSGNQTFVASTLIDIYNGTNATGARILLRHEETGSQKRVLQSMVGQKRTVTADVSFVAFRIAFFSQQSYVVLNVLLSVGFAIFMTLITVVIFFWLRNRYNCTKEKASPLPGHQEPNNGIVPTPAGI